MSNKPTHDILLAETYTNSNSEEKSYFTNIGSAWLKDSGTITCELRPGLSVSGRFVIIEKKEENAGAFQ